jgi:hypothetical protein
VRGLRIAKLPSYRRPVVGLPNSGAGTGASFAYS